MQTCSGADLLRMIRNAEIINQRSIVFCEVIVGKLLEEATSDTIEIDFRGHRYGAALVQEPGTGRELNINTIVNYLTEQNGYEAYTKPCGDTNTTLIVRVPILD